MQALRECIYVIWEGYQITTMRYGETGFDVWGDAEKGEGKVLMESSVIHFIQTIFLIICTLWELLCAPEGSDTLQDDKSLLTNSGGVLKEYGWQKTRFVKQHVEQLMHPFFFPLKKRN